MFITCSLASFLPSLLLVADFLCHTKQIYVNATNPNQESRKTNFLNYRQINDKSFCVVHVVVGNNEQHVQKPKRKKLPPTLLCKAQHKRQLSQ